ncbi:MAG: LytTR family DNA-binding domain-containing protein [Pseudomonadota bacterium]
MLERSKQFHERFQETARAAQTVETGRHWLVQKGLGRWLFALILGVGLALIGPYGTFITMSLPMRLAYWVGLILGSFAIWWAIEVMIGRIFGPRGVIFKQLTVIVPFAAANSLLLTGLHIAINSATAQTIPTSWSYYFVSHIALSTLVIAPLILLTIALLTQVEARASGDTIQFLTLALPPSLRGQTPYALAAEGHYVRVHTKLGEALITMRFEDALRALSGVDGIQTHRSWWVAREEILEVRPVGSAYEASLRCGMRVPISRRRKAMVTRGLTDLHAASVF